MAKVAINGLGRIGRATFKIVLDNPDLELVACNDLIPVDNLAYLLRYDTVYGRYNKEVRAADGSLVVDGRTYRVFSEKDPSRLPWADSEVDAVFECTGIFTREEDLRKHLQAGAKHAILSAPSKSETVPTVVHGVNTPEDVPDLVSCASCTTNCITPVMEVLDRRLGAEKAFMNSTHAYTSTQALVDGPNKKFRRGRSGAANLVPTSTGAAVATTRALPHLAGRFDGSAVRAPVTCGSIANIICLTRRATSVEEINDIFREETQTERYREVLGVCGDPIVSSDIVADPRASVVDTTLTQVVDGNLVSVMSWYDNEWGYAAQMVRAAAAMLRAPVPAG